MALTRDTHRRSGNALPGVAGGAVYAGGQALRGHLIFDRDARVPALPLSDHRAEAAPAARTTERRGPTPSAPELLVAEHSA